MNPPMNVNDSDHSEPARLSVFAHSPGVMQGGKVQGAKMKTNTQGDIEINKDRNE